MRRTPLSLSLALLVGVLASMIRAGQSKRVDFVISGSHDFAVTRSPKEHAVYDGWPVDYRASAREIPENVSSFRVEGVHLSGIRARVHDSIRNTHRAPVNGGW